MQNKMISQLHNEIIQCKNQIIDKFLLLSNGWTKRFALKQLFDKNKMIKLQKQIDKTQSTTEIERQIQFFQMYRETNTRLSSEQ